MDAVKKNRNTAALRRGGYLAGVTAAAVAVVVLLNLIVGQLPSHLREFDMTDNSLYAVSDASRALLAGLDKDVEIIVLAEEGTVDQRITKYLDAYAACSPRVSVTEVDPVAHPTATAEYEAQADSLVVRCEDTGRQEVLSFSQIIVYTMDYNTFSYQESEFDAEGQLTSAISSITGENTEKIYLTAGHGEAAPAGQVTDAIAKANVDTGEISLLKDGAIPEDCSLLLAYEPAKDLTAEELELVRDYLARGGQVMVILPQEETALANWEALLGEYGLETVPGYVADPQRYYQQFRSPYAIYPVLSAESGVTSGYSDDDLLLLINARGMRQVDPARDTVTVDPFLTTSDQALAVSGEDQTQGTWVLGAAATETTDAGTARLTVLSAASLVDGDLLSQYAGTVVNLELFMSALTAGMESVGNISIPAKSLAVTYNTIPSAGLWSSLFLFVLPVLVLLGGLIYWGKRRKR